jgi:hypothetical protein
MVRAPKIDTFIVPKSAVKCDMEFGDEDMRGKTEDEQKKVLKGARKNEVDAHQNFAAFYA